MVTFMGINRSSQVAIVVKNPPLNAGDTRDTVSIPGLGRSPGVGRLFLTILSDNRSRWKSLIILSKPLF